MALDRTATHEIMARPLHDDASRTDYVVSLKQFLSRLSGGAQRAFDGRGSARFQAETGRSPSTQDEIRSIVTADPFYQVWSAFNRSAQDVMWRSIHDAIVHDRPRMTAAAAKLVNRPAGGSLTIDPDFKPPAYAFAAEIHGQPGGYLRTDDDQDLTAGAL
jgi:hypothetical protein